MDLKRLEGEFIVLNYSFGPYWNEEIGGENALTIWQITGGKLEQRYHPGEPNEIDNERPVQLLRERGIRQVYTPSLDLYLKTNNFLGLEMRNDGGEHEDEDGITDWMEYDSLYEGDENWDRLKIAGLEILLIK